MHQHPNGRACYRNGCTEGEKVPIVCPGCEQVLGHAPKGGIAQASATEDTILLHLPTCSLRRPSEA